MATKDIHAGKTKKIIDSMLLDIDESETNPHRKKEIELLRLAEIENEYRVSHIVMRIREIDTKVYIWAGWHSRSDSSYMFLTSHMIIEGFPDRIEQPVSYTITPQSMTENDWYRIAAGLSCCWYPGPEHAVNHDDKLLSPIVFWMKSIANEILAGKSVQTD